VASRAGTSLPMDGYMERLEGKQERAHYYALVE
jgi:hypothetical protein